MSATGWISETLPDRNYSPARNLVQAGLTGRLRYGGGRHDRALTRGMSKTQHFRRRKHLGSNRVHFDQTRAGSVQEVRGMSLPDNSSRFLNSIGCTAELLGDVRLLLVAILVLRRVH
jgi:hypothetical protein